MTVWSPPAGSISKVAGTGPAGPSSQILLGPLVLAATGLPSGVTGTAALPLGPLTLAATGSVPAGPLAGYAAWYDATQLTGLADGASVATWPDLSPNGYNLTQPTGANQPTYHSTTPAGLIHGHPAVSFNGTNNSMATAAVNVPATQAYSVFVVCQVVNYSTYNGLWTHTNSGSPAPFDYYLDASDGLPELVAWTIIAGTAAPSAGVAHNVEYLCDPAVGAYHFLDGAANGSAVGGTGQAGGSYPFILGSRGATTWMNGLIGEVLYYPSLLSAANRQSVETYLRAKWGTP